MSTEPPSSMCVGLMEKKAHGQVPRPQRQTSAGWLDMCEKWR